LDKINTLDHPTMSDGAFPAFQTRTPHSVDDDPSGLLGLLMRALDEVDYGLMLFRRDQTLWYGNHLARAMLGRGDRLYLDHGQVRARSGAHQAAWQSGLGRAAQGMRCLLDIPALHGDGSDSALALVPMAHPAEHPGRAVPVLLISCRSALCAPLSLRFFAQTHGLTRTEEAVLVDLVHGMEVEDIASQRDMAVSTARSHVKQLRIKTRSTSMRELLNKVAVLPPVVSAVRTLG
jgi:DNA-binding CsgD family transcriptional regulator